MIGYTMTIPPGSIISNPCAHITIQSTGVSAYVHDGHYELFIFGTYRFVSIDARGNNIYHANIQGDDWFITKDIENGWIVSVIMLHRSKRILCN